MRSISILTAGLMLAAMAVVPTAAAVHEDPTEPPCDPQSVADARGAENLWINQRAVLQPDAFGDEGVLYAEDNGLNGLQTQNTENCQHGPDIRFDEDPGGAAMALLAPLL